MNRAVISLFLAACAGTGCVSMPSWYSKPQPPTVAAKPVRPRPAVSADQITDDNAKEMASALLDELDRDSQAESSPATEKAPGEAKTADEKRR